MLGVFPAVLCGLALLDGDLISLLGLDVHCSMMWVVGIVWVGKERTSYVCAWVEAKDEG